jgi:hypothetical protein
MIFSEKYGNWSINWSKCNSKCKQYKSRKCLTAPCPKTELYQFRDCPAEENTNIPACSGTTATPGESKPHKQPSPHFFNQHLGYIRCMHLFQYSGRAHLSSFSSLYPLTNSSLTPSKCHVSISGESIK